MAYLSEQLSRREFGINANTDSSSASRIDKQPRSSDNTEHINVQIARDLNEHKIRLINALAHFPVTALWLLNEYEKLPDNDADDDSAVANSDLGQSLAEVRKHYHSLFSSEQPSDDTLANDSLSKFPYSFNDLTSITDIIAYMVQFDKHEQSTLLNQHNNQQAKIAVQKRRHRLSKKRLLDFLDNHAYSQEEQDFLFLPLPMRLEYAAELLTAEQSWLRTRQELAKANTKLVMFIANQYKSSFLDFDDLVQEGQTGLLKAVDKFDYRLGFQFSTYAGYWIRQAISRSLSRSERLVRIPCGQVANINKVFRAKTELSAKTGLDPTIQEIAEYTKLSEDEINTIFTISQTAISLENTSDDEDSFSPIDFIEQHVFTHAFETMAKDDLEQLINKAITCLNPREAKIVCAHFGMDCDKESTLQEIGTELNLTRERVRQIQVMALNKMKLNYGNQLHCFL
ncbi:sigma-70 family RNA polymerase sigma factor [Methylocucumis oryzae]|nr:RNA polymerase sigma factor RpoD/SigA [Methylocucumis oryzae]